MLSKFGAVRFSLSLHLHHVQSSVYRTQRFRGQLTSPHLSLTHTCRTLASDNLNLGSPKHLLSSHSPRLVIPFLRETVGVTVAGQLTSTMPSTNELS